MIFAMQIAGRINGRNGQLSGPMSSSHPQVRFFRRWIVTGFHLRSVGPLLLLAIAAFSCGGNHQLQNVNIQPPQADAKNFPNGQVPFVAKGTFSGSSTVVTLTSKDILWCYGGTANTMTAIPGACAGNIAQFATVDQNGLAQCNPSFQGSVYILAGVASGSSMPDEGPRLKVFGSATLTCP